MSSPYAPKNRRSGKRKRAASNTAAESIPLTTEREVLFFGDSLTWGMHHAQAARYKKSWPQLLEPRLHSAGFRMVESALCSRTTCHDDGWERNDDWMPGAEPHFFNGLHHFGPLFSSHTPRVLVLALGTNDLKVRIREKTYPRGEHTMQKGQRTAQEEAAVIAENCAKIGEKARLLHTGFCHEGELKIVVLTPPELVFNEESEQMGYDAFSAEISHEFPKAFKDMCIAHNFICVDADPPSMEHSVDGVHFTKSAQAQLAEDVWGVLKIVLAPRAPRRSLRHRKESRRYEHETR